MRRRIVAATLAVLTAFATACGGGPRSTSADLWAIRQPTPDPTLDAVVRDLPHALAGVVAPTPTPTPTAAVVAVQKPAAKATAPSAKPPPTRPPTPTSKAPAARPVTTATPAAARH